MAPEAPAVVPDARPSSRGSCGRRPAGPGAIHTRLAHAVGAAASYKLEAQASESSDVPDSPGVAHGRQGRRSSLAPSIDSLDGAPAGTPSRLHVTAASSPEALPEEPHGPSRGLLPLGDVRPPEVEPMRPVRGHVGLDRLARGPEPVDVEVDHRGGRARV